MVFDAVFRQIASDCTTVTLGQLNIFILFLLSLAYLSYLTETHVVTGVSLAVATWLKVWPLVLIGYFIYKREWKILIIAVIAFMIVGGVTIWLAGTEQVFIYFKHILPKMVFEGILRRNDHLDQSIPGFFAKLFAPSSGYVRPLIENPTLASTGSLVSRILIIFSTVALCSIPIKIKNTEQFLSEFSLVIVTTLLITQRLWEASLTVFLPLYFIIAFRVEKVQGKRWLLLSLTILSIVMINLFRVIWAIGNPDKNALPWYFLVTPFIGTILLWFIFAWMRFNEIGLHFYSKTPKFMEDMQSFN